MSSDIKKVQKLNGDIVQGDKFEYYHRVGYPPPPPNHPKARKCPQCEQETWKKTELCCHCGCNLFKHDQDRHELISDLLRLLAFSFVMCVFGIMTDNRFATFFFPAIPLAIWGVVVAKKKFKKEGV